METKQSIFEMLDQLIADNPHLSIAPEHYKILMREEYLDDFFRESEKYLVNGHCKQVIDSRCELGFYDGILLQKSDKIRCCLVVALREDYDGNR